MSFETGFYLIDHRLITLAMVALLVAAGEIGFRRGSRKRESKESVRSLMSGTGGAMLGLLGLLLGFSLSIRKTGRWRTNCQKQVRNQVMHSRAMGPAVDQPWPKRWIGPPIGPFVSISPGPPSSTLDFRLTESAAPTPHARLRNGTRENWN